MLGGGVAILASTRASRWTATPRKAAGVARARRSSLLGGFNRPIANEINDSRVTLSLWHSFGVNTRLFARLGTLGGDVNELVLSLNGYIPRLDLLYDVDYRQLFDTTGDTTADLSPFYQILGQYRQHKTLYIGLHRPITKRVTLSLEGEIRDAKNDDFYTGSRDYYRLATVLYVEDLYREFDVSTSLEYWDTSEGEGYWTVTGEVERKWETVKWRAGVDFVRYKDRVIEYDYRTARLNDAIVALLPGVYPGRSFFAQYAATRVVDTRENVYSIFTDIEWEFGRTRGCSPGILRGRRRARFAILAAPVTTGYDSMKNGMEIIRGRASAGPWQPGWRSTAPFIFGGASWRAAAEPHSCGLKSGHNAHIDSSSTHHLPHLGGRRARDARSRPVQYLPRDRSRRRDGGRSRNVSADGPRALLPHRDDQSVDPLVKRMSVETIFGHAEHMDAEISCMECHKTPVKSPISRRPAHALVHGLPQDQRRAHAGVGRAQYRLCRQRMRDLPLRDHRGNPPQVPQRRAHRARLAGPLAENTR